MNKVRTYQRFEDLPPAYETLFKDADATADVFQTLPWFRNLAATGLEKNIALRIYTIESGVDIIRPSLALPMCHQTIGRKFLSPRRLTALSTFYTSLFNPIIGTSRALTESSIEEDLHQLASAIAAERPRWDTIDLHPMTADSPIFNGLVQAFRKNGMAAQAYFCFGNWYLEVNGRTFQEYCSTLPSKLRNTLKRKSAQLENAQRMRIRIYSTLDELDEGIAAYEKIYHASWKTPETFPAFIPGLIRTCAEQGWLRLGISYIDEQPAAAQIWIVHHDVASIYKLAYDERFSSFSIGTLLTAHLMQHVIDVDRVHQVDYLTGDDAYKQDWMSHRRERVGLIAFNLHSLRGLLAACKHIGGRTIKKIIRRHVSSS